MDFIKKQHEKGEDMIQTIFAILSNFIMGFIVFALTLLHSERPEWHTIWPF